jgi:hypothetical protein
MSQENKVLIIHDTYGTAESRADFLTFMYGIAAIGISSAGDAFRFLEEGRLRNVSTVVIHKDLGDDSGEKPRFPGSSLAEELIDAIREQNETIRIGIVSGEFPRGLSTVLKMKADFYFNFPIKENSAAFEWLLKELNKGPCFPKEIEARGKKVAMPPNL